MRFHFSHEFGAEKLHEYQWPLEGKCDWFMIQEQVSVFLGVKSFKRKYPGNVPCVCKKKNALTESLRVCYDLKSWNVEPSI